MSDTQTAPRPRGATWIPWVAALLGFGVQIIWFSSLFGAISARVEDAERRISSIEQNGSPVVQGLRTEMSINTRRLATLEDQYATKVSSLLTDTAAQTERLNLIKSEVESLRQWRIAHVQADGSIDGRLVALDRQLQQMQTEHNALAHDIGAATRPRQRP